MALILREKGLLLTDKFEVSRGTPQVGSFMKCF